MKRSGAVFVLVAFITSTACGPEASDRPGAPVRLAAATTDAYATPSEVTVQRLSVSEYLDFYASSVSPDGRYMSMVDWSSFDLAVRDLRTGELHRLNGARNVAGEQEEIAYTSVFSPDGRRIAYALFGSGTQLRVLDFEPDAAGVPRAGDPTIVLDNPEIEPRYPFDWSPDGRHIVATVYAAGNTRQLALISVEDGTYRALESFDWREPVRAGFSPDGRFIAYTVPDADSEERGVFVVSVDGTREARIADGRLLGWHDGGDLLFHGTHGGTPGVWRIPIADGRPSGAPSLIKADMWGIEALGFAGDSFYYGIAVNSRRLHIAPVNLEQGRTVGPPVAVDDPSRTIRGWDWSPDGKFLAYSASAPGPGGSTIVIRSQDGEELKAIRLDLEPTRRIRWTPPDARSLIVFTDDARGRSGFYRIDLETGSYSTIVRNNQLEAPTPRGDFDISADGRTIFFGTVPFEDGGDPSGWLWSLLAYDIESGASRSITPAEWRVLPMGPTTGTVALSPDGTRLALQAPDTTTAEPVQWIGTIPVEGGPFTPLIRVPDGHHAFSPQWTSDGRALVFSMIQPDLPTADQWKTWIAPVEGGEARPIELPEHLDGRGVQLHPDDRRITFLAGEPRGEVWVMDGIDWSGGRDREDEPR